MTDARDLALPPEREPTEEDLTIQAVTEAARAAFDPSGERPLSLLNTVRTTAALVAFLKAAEDMPTRSLTTWRESIENLVIQLGEPSHAD
jgi:hypothetical protein